MQSDQPYRHPAIESIIRHVFFHGSSATTYDGIYHSSIPELDEREVPIPMVALAAAAVSVGSHLLLSRLNCNRYTLLLTTGAVTEDRFRRACMKTSTAATLRHSRASRLPMLVHSTR